MPALKKQEIQRMLAMARDSLGAGSLGMAQALAEQVIADQPRHAAAHELLAYVAGRGGRPDEAHRLLEIACSQADASTEAWYYLGKSWFAQGDDRAAIAAFQRAMKKGGVFFEALCDLGTAQARAGDRAAALQSYSRAERLRPRDPELLFNLGALHDETGEYAKSAAYYERCLALAPQHVAAWSNRGVALHLTGHHEAALEHFDRALALQPDHVDSWTNKALTLAEMRRGDAARACFDRALALKPADPTILWNLAQLQLISGDLEQGWVNYRHRWHKPDAETYRHDTLRELPSLAAARDQRVLVWCEQGYGDNLQFARYVPLLVAAGAQVTFETQAALLPLFAGQLGCTVVARGTAGQDFAYQVPLATLPALFGTTLATIPPALPALQADAQLIETWRTRLQWPAGRPRIGIACSGNAALDQRQGQRRPIALERLVAACGDVELVLIQNELRAADRAFLQRAPQVRHPEALIETFADSAAIVAQVDLVVTIDTSLAHLAGAMGQRLVVLLAYAPDWRWLLDRDDSPWYPGARLLRQAASGDWDSVLAQLPQLITAMLPAPG